jgi:hypothetical protein
MNVYSRDVMVCATVYVKASSAKAADIAIRKIEGLSPIFRYDSLRYGHEMKTHGEVPMFGGEYDSPDMPKVSLRPEMTIHGHWPGSAVKFVEAALVVTPGNSVDDFMIHFQKPRP